MAGEDNCKDSLGRKLSPKSGISRRGLLGGAGAIVSSYALGAEPKSDSAKIEIHGDQAVIRLGHLHATLERIAFGEAARFVQLPPVLSEQEIKSLTLRVRDGAWPGWRSPVWDIVLEQTATAWQISVLLRAEGRKFFFKPVDLAAFLKDSSELKDRSLSSFPSLQLTAGDASKLLREPFGTHLVSEREVSIGFRPDGTWVVSGERLFAPAAKAQVSQIIVGWRARNGADGEGARVAGDWLTHRTWFGGAGTLSRAAAIRLGNASPYLDLRMPAGARVDLAAVEGNVTTAVSFDDPKAPLKLDLVQGDKPASAVREGPFSLQSWLVLATGPAAQPNRELRGRLTTAKAAPISTLHGTFDVMGLEPSRAPQVVATSMPFRFEARALLSAMSIDIPDGRANGSSGSRPWSRLTFRGQECVFRAGEDPPAAAAPLVRLGLSAAGLQDLDWARPAVRLPLDRAALRVVRPEDLLALDFSFRGLVLEQARGAGRIVPAVTGCAAAPAIGGAPAPESRPLLVVNFPPQHTAERAYLRQFNEELATPKISQANAKLQAVLRNRRDPEARRALMAELAALPDKGGYHIFLETLGKIAQVGANTYLGPGGQALYAAWTKLPPDQQIFLGDDPRLTDPDAMACARAIQNARARVVDASPPPETADEGRAYLAQRLPEVALPRLTDQAIRQAVSPANPDELNLKSTGPSNDNYRDAWRAEMFRRDPAYQDFTNRYEAFCKEAANAKDVPGPLQTFLTRDITLEIYKNLRVDLRPFMRAMGRFFAGLSAETAHYEAFASVTQARLSGVSRLAFHVNCRDERADVATTSEDIASTGTGGAVAIPLTVDGLTDWSRFDLAVTRRAEVLYRDDHGRIPGRPYRNEDLDDANILEFQGITPGADVGRRLEEIRSRLVPPSELETAIELPFRLILSPSQNARFRVPRKVPDAVFDAADHLSPVPISLWTATLDKDSGRPDVRAVWSPDVRREAFQPLGQPPTRGGAWAPWRLEYPDAGGRPRERFRTGLEAYDRHEIVALSSVYGLPVLGRRLESGGLADGSQMEPPERYKLDETGTIARGFLAQSGIAGRSAIFRPQPLTVQEMVLSMLGGTLDLDTIFVAPAALRDTEGHPLYPSFSLERWRQRTVLGRDILVEVVYKGYLFPFGIRASLVKLTERRFYPHPEGHHPTAFLIQRMFLRVGRPSKNFPALGQPSVGRAWSPETLKLLTLRTPDIVDPTGSAGVASGQEFSNGKLQFKNASGRIVPGLIFWPRTRPYADGNISFQFEIDGQAASVSAPLVFVDNVAANEPEALKGLVAYYNDAVRRGLRTIAHGGTQRRYAKENKPGDTSHETHSWEIEAEGRGGSDAINFAMDPFMEGADQPPFYPRLKTARIRLSAAERFVGSRLDLVDVAYDANYLSDGFTSKDIENFNSDQVHNAYLRLVQQSDPKTGAALALSMGDAGDRSGGLARPNMNVVGLSRSTGLVGGANPPPAAAASPSAPAPASARPSSALPNFDPTQLFASDAKILGIVSFQDLLKTVALTQGNAPRLLEQVDHTMAGVIDAPMMETAQREVLGPLLTFTREVMDGWDKLIKAAAIGSDMTLDTLYPDVSQGLKKLINQLETSARATEVPVFLGTLAGVYESGRQMVALLDRIAADPVAPLREKLRRGLAELWNVADEIREQISANLHALDSVAKTIVNELSAGVVQHIASVLPPFDWPADVPQDVRIKVQESLEARSQELLQALIKGNSVSASQIATKLSQDLITIAHDQNPAVGKHLEIQARRLEDFAQAVERQARAQLIYTAKSALERAPEKDREQVKTLAAALTQLGQGILAPQELAEEVAKTFSGSSSDILGLFASDRDFMSTPDSYALLQVPAESVSTSVIKAVRALRSLRDGAITTEEVRRDILAPLFELPRAFDILAEGGALADALVRLQGNAASTAISACERITAPVLQALKATGQAVQGPVTDFVSVLDDLEAALTGSSSTVKDLRAEVTRQREAVKGAMADLQRTANALDGAAVCKDIQGKVAAVGPFFTARATLVGAITTTVRNVGAGDWTAAFNTPAKQKQLLPLLRPFAAKTVKVLEATIDLRTTPDSVAAALAGLQSELANAGQALAADAKLQGTKPLDWLKATATRLAAVQAAYASAAASLQKAANEAGNAFQAATDAALPDALRQGLSLLRPNETGQDAFAEVEGVILARFDRATRDAIGLMFVTEKSVIEQLRGKCEAPLKDVAKVINAMVYVPIVTARNKLFTGAESSEIGKYLNLQVLILDPVLPDGPPYTNDALAQEARQVSLIIDAAGRDQRFSALAAWRALWRPDPAPVRLIGQIDGVIRHALQGDIAALIDVQSVKRQVEDRIKTLVPSKISTSYTMSLPVSNIDPLVVFEGDKQVDIVTSAKIDVLNGGPPEFHVKGRLPALALKLLPVFDVATLHLRESTFESGSGIASRLSIDIERVDLGEKVSFIQQLAPFLGAPADGSGFYLAASSERLGIVAGYKFALPPFNIGNLGFSNVSLNCACDLPFDSGDARFLISVGRVDAPFMIAAAPYAGAGHIGLTANAHGIIGFEASMQYGGGGVFAFGPLTGEGRVSMGIFIRQVSGYTTVYGLFSCTGSARIACFSSSTSLFVSLTQDDNGLSGMAVYQFSFSLGIKTIEFKVKVQKNESNGGKREHQAGIAAPGPTRYAALAQKDGPLVLSDAPARLAGDVPPPPASAKSAKIRLVNTAVSQGSNWAIYNNYFDMNSIAEVYP